MTFLKGFDFGEIPSEVVNLVTERGFFSMVAVGAKAFAFGGKYVDMTILFGGKHVNMKILFGGKYVNMKILFGGKFVN